MATANIASKLAVSIRTEKGKGAARRARRAGNVPAVLYGHGTDPKHLSVPARDFAAILRNNGLNAIIELDIEGEKQLALPKQVDVHPIRNYIEHTDFVIIRKGEKVTVEVSILVEGEAVSGSLVTNDASVIEIEADALSIPESLTVSIEGLEIGSTITAADIDLPEGVSLISDPETLILAVNEAQKADTDSDAGDAAASADTEEAPAE